MKYSIVYSKSDGNTKLLADTVYESLNKDECLYFGKTCDEALNADIIFIGFWTIRGMCDDITKDLLSKITNQKVFLFGSAGFGLSDDYFKEIINASMNYLDNNVEVLNTYMCQGKMKMAVREKYEALKKANPMDMNVDMMIKNFDLALSHPDSDDLLKLSNLVKKVGHIYGFAL